MWTLAKVYSAVLFSFGYMKPKGMSFVVILIIKILSKSSLAYS